MIIDAKFTESEHNINGLFGTLLKGEKGDKGDALKFEDLTDEQKAELGGSYDYKGTVEATDRKTGYIAFDLYRGEAVEILVSAFEDGETYRSTLMRIICGDSHFHSHNFTVEVGTDYPKYTKSDIGFDSTWYIPITLEQYAKSPVYVYAKGIVKKLAYDINVRFVDTLPDEAEEITPTSYATKKEIGNIDKALDSIIEIQNTLIGGDA